MQIQDKLVLIFEWISYWFGWDKTLSLLHTCYNNQTFSNILFFTLQREVLYMLELSSRDNCCYDKFSVVCLLIVFNIYIYIYIFNRMNDLCTKILVRQRYCLLSNLSRSLVAQLGRWRHREHRNITMAIF